MDFRSQNIREQSDKMDQAELDQRIKQMMQLEKMIEQYSIDNYKSEMRS